MRLDDLFGDLAKDVERFLAKLSIAEGPLDTACWQWTGARSRGQGNVQWYGSFRWRGATWRAHKWSFVHVGRRLFVPGHHLDHLCSCSLCVNPRHLEMVTRGENQARKYGREHAYH